MTTFELALNKLAKWRSVFAGWMERTLEREAMLLDRDYEGKFPGFKTHQYGVDIDMRQAQETMRGWRP